MTPIPRERWLTIESYRDFYDVPHLLIAKDVDGTRWLFENPFDDALDDYGTHFAVFEVEDGNSFGDVKRAIVARTCDPAELIPKQHVKFDQTARAKVFVCDETTGDDKS